MEFDMRIFRIFPLNSGLSDIREPAARFPKYRYYARIRGVIFFARGFDFA